MPHKENCCEVSMPGCVARTLIISLYVASLLIAYSRMENSPFIFYSMSQGHHLEQFSCLIASGQAMFASGTFLHVILIFRQQFG
jgi:hypothetical protein